jgi:phosphoribosylanthranilate isomerase
VKICGITSVGDAQAAVRCGADAIGLVLWAGSPRAVTMQAARQIAAALPPFVARVGVFVDASPEDVRSAVRLIGLDAAQLHGGEDVDRYVDVGTRLIRAVSIEDAAAREAARRLPPGVMPLVDSADPVLKGGTGRVTDWEEAARLASERPIVLAGGLTALNVAEAVRRVRPWAVDVSSGVEAAPGRKSVERLEAFFSAALDVDQPGGSRAGSRP